jgi:hypothetical protein
LISRRPIAATAAAVAIIAAIAVCGCGGGNHGGGPPPAGEPAPGDVWRSSGFFGVNAPLLRGYDTPERAQALDALAASMADAGVRWARVVFDQSVEQRLPDQTDWTIPDRVVGALARHGVRTDALFVGTASRDATTSLLCGSLAYPSDADGWAGFVGDAVERYGRGGAFWADHPDLQPLPIETWEIGNEENIHQFWCPAADPEQYAKVYATARIAAHDADADAQVIVGGLAPTFSASPPGGDVNVPDFLKRFISADPALAGRIPAVAVHLYGPSPNVDLLELRAYRQALDRAGLAKTPMLVNEAGWHTQGPHDARYAPDASRAAFIRELAAVSRRTDCNVVGFGVHAWVTAQQDTADPEDWYGLADPLTGAPNASGRGYAAGIREAESQPSTPAKGRLGRLCG